MKVIAVSAVAGTGFGGDEINDRASPMQSRSPTGEPTARPKTVVQFNLSVLVGLVLVSAVGFAAIRVLQNIDVYDEMSVLGWFLFAAISVIGASIYWNQTRHYKAYFNEVERTNDENRQRMQESGQRVERLLALQQETNSLLRDVLNELRQKTELKE